MSEDEDLTTPPTEAPCSRKQRLRKILASLLCLLLLFFTFHKTLLSSLQAPLIRREQPTKADLIIVMGGGHGQRVEQAVKLWKQNLSSSKTILMAGGPIYRKLTWAQVMRDYAIELGIPPKHVHAQNLSLTTTDDAQRSLEYMNQHGFKSAIIVTDAFHSRRAHRAFQKASNGQHLFLSCPAPNPKENWWQNDVLTRYLVSEYLKWIWSR